MNKAVNRLRLFLCIFSGEDDYIIRKCQSGIHFSFASIGIFVILIFIGCYLSAYEFANCLFERSMFISFPIGIVWALVITNMYLLLLYTVSPPILPQKTSSEVIKTPAFFTASMLFRIGFIALLAIIIAQPLNVKLLSNSIQTSLNKHIIEEKVRMIVVSDSILIKNELEIFSNFNSHLLTKGTNAEIRNAEINLERISSKVSEDMIFMAHSKTLLDSLNFIENKIWINKSLNRKKDSIVFLLSELVNNEINSDIEFLGTIDNIKINNNKFQDEYSYCQENLKKAIQAKVDNNNNLNYLLSQTNFFIKRIQLILSENIWAWAINITICMLFLLPIYFKYKVRDKTDFYSEKIQIEHQIINDEYKEFKNIYSEVLTNKTKEYNNDSKLRIIEKLDILKEINPEKYSIIMLEIDEEYDNSIISKKYEYWLDSPFRTIKTKPRQLKNTENDLLQLLYPDLIEDKGKTYE